MANDCKALALAGWGIAAVALGLLWMLWSISPLESDECIERWYGQVTDTGCICSIDQRGGGSVALDAVIPHGSHAQIDPEDIYNLDHLVWCFNTYHRSPDCPLYGRVGPPADVLKEEEAEHREWCDSIDHRNVGCPEYRERREERLKREERDAEN